MNKVLIHWVAFICSLFMFTSCSQSLGGDVIWDYNNICFNITVQNADGQSLIDPFSAEGDAWMRQIYVEYNGKKFYNDGLAPRTELRAMIEMYRGLYVEKKNDPVKNSFHYVLRFGEFQPQYGTKQAFYVILPDGGRHKIEFTRTANGGDISHHTWVNGLPQTSETDIVLQAKAYRTSAQHAPVYLYVFLPEERDSQLSDEVMSTANVIYHDQKYSLRDIGTPISLALRADKRLIYDTHDRAVGNPYAQQHFLSFGPLTPSDKPIIERVQLRIGRKAWEVDLSCYIDQVSGMLQYHALVINSSDGSTSYRYYRNGPAVYVYHKQP